MYSPAAFAGPPDGLARLLEVAPLVDLVTVGADGLIATPLPMLLDPATGDHGALVGHVARANDHWRAHGSESLVIVRGPDAYISPSWYTSKAEHGRVVPTWNYLVAHVHGRLVTHDDPAWTEDVVRRLTDFFEGHRVGRPGSEDDSTRLAVERPRAQPWSVDDAPRRFVEGQVRAIVGVELVIARIEVKYKLGQNRSAADRQGAISGLGVGTRDEQAVAAAMESAMEATMESAGPARAADPVTPEAAARP